MKKRNSQTVAPKDTSKKTPKSHGFFYRHKLWIILVAIIGFIYALMKMNNQYSSPGFYGHLSIPGRFLITNFSQFVGGAGMAIIFLTVIVRLGLLPSMVGQAKMSTRNSYRQKLYKPQILKIRLAYIHAKKKMKATDSIKEKKHYKQEAQHQSDRLMAFYGDHHLGLQNMGCGAVLYQIPIFGMLYASIRYSPEIQHAHFLGVALGKPNVVFAGIAFAFYVVNALIMKQNTNRRQAKKKKPKTDEDKAQRARNDHMTNVMLFGMPLWIGFISLSTSAGLTLYFCVGGLFVIGQQLYLRHALPKVRKRAKAEMEAIKSKNKRKLRIKAKRPKKSKKKK